MLLASVNINKRLGNPIVRAALTSWLRLNRIDVLLAQEPWKPVDREPVDLADFRAAGGDGRLYAWIGRQWSVPSCDSPEPFVQRVELEWMVILNVHLSAYSAAERGRQLDRLRELLVAEKGRPVILCGDFNLAPRPCDGVAGGRPSSFNSTVDRGPFRRLLSDHQLADMTSKGDPGYTVERTLRGASIRFRCDLVLAPLYLAGGLTVRADHSVRDAASSFTDHSAMIIEAPVSLTPATVEDDDSLFAFLPQDVRSSPPSHDSQPHKTAMSRRSESSYAREVAKVLCPHLGLTSVLDHGCGRGSDVDFYRSMGLVAAGWDPHPGFGATTEPGRLFDMVTNVFVLNVLPDPWQRIRALRHAARFLEPGGHLLVVARSPVDIGPRAASASWPVHHDGFWSSTAKSTFQKGLTAEEIVGLAWQAGLVPAAAQDLLTTTPTATQVLLTPCR
ncbi:hypothetical protein Acsp01_25330 [Actinoplanes sp. NBRC 101535]|nr:hypothetical protein Acsp01_25330 [Actinoplanes sp. NBRC 101535]